jgi:hypothetical protein
MNQDMILSHGPLPHIDCGDGRQANRAIRIEQMMKSRLYGGLGSVLGGRVEYLEREQAGQAKSVLSLVGRSEPRSS